MFAAALRCRLSQSRRPLSGLLPRRRNLWQSPPVRSFLKPSKCLRQEIANSTPQARLAIPEASFYEKIGKPGASRQVIFWLLGTTAVFVLAAAETTITTEYWTERMVSLSSVWTLKTITNTDLKRAQNADLIQRLRERLASINSTIQNLPLLIRPWINLACVSVMQPYADASEGKRLCWKICLLNLGVWGAWKIGRWRPFMTTWFMHNPLSGRSLTLLASMFSHRSAMHLLFNCLALESFGSAAYYYLVKEQSKAEPQVLEATSSYHFLAFFVSAGVFSGLVSHVVSTKFRYPRLVAQLASPANAPRRTETWSAALAASGATTSTAAAAASAASSEVAKKGVLEILPSLGASGAIYAAVTMTALAFPDSQVALFIPPSYPINIQTGVGGLLLLDMIGIARGWRFFDHWAHLGGAAFGVAYYNYGPTIWNSLRLAAQ